MGELQVCAAAEDVKGLARRRQHPRQLPQDGRRRIAQPLPHAHVIVIRKLVEEMLHVARIGTRTRINPSGARTYVLGIRIGDVSEFERRLQ